MQRTCPAIYIENMSAGYPGAESDIIQDISLLVPEGVRVAILGPNGSGKTTLLRAIIRNLKYKGRVELFGKDISDMRRRDIAAHISLLTQLYDDEVSFSVRQTVAMGQYARDAVSDKRLEEELSEILDITGLSELAETRVSSLSGGQRQRVYLARTFAQKTPIMLLDEPISFLDPKYQAQIMRLLNDWSKGETESVDGGKHRNTLIGIYHDPVFAKAMSDYMIFMKQGRIAGFEKTEDVDFQKQLSAVYDMDVYTHIKELYDKW